MPSLPENLKLWENATLGFLYPEACQLCGARATAGDCYLCEDCRSEAKLIARPFCERCGLPYEGAITTRFECENCRDMALQFCSARSAVVAGETVLDIIHRYKYQRAFWFEPFLAELLIKQAKPELRKEQWTWIVPIPLHPVKKREREFNQAERLAERLGAALDIPVKGDLLRRVLPTRTQTQLTRQERLIKIGRAHV